MLTFTLYTADDYDRSRRQVHIDPAAVISIEEAERRPAYGGYWQVAVITLVTGDKHIVEDSSRTAARKIAEAKQRAQVIAITSSEGGIHEDEAAEEGL